MSGRQILRLICQSYTSIIGIACSIATAEELSLKHPGGSSLWVSGLQSLMIGVGLLLATGAVLLWWSRKSAGRVAPSNGNIAPIVRVSRRLTRKTVGLVIDWRGKQYLLMESQSGAITLLDSRSEQEAGT